MNHMAWVTHGSAFLGKCPLDARCICELCWEVLKQQRQKLPVHGALSALLTTHMLRYEGAAGVGLSCKDSC